MTIRGLLFWGFVDDEGKLFIKRYTTDRVIENYERMPFVKGIFEPFEAFDMQHAKQKILERWQKELN